MNGFQKLDNWSFALLMAIFFLVLYTTLFYIRPLSNHLAESFTGKITESFAGINKTTYGSAGEIASFQ